jgi:Concanavalin A-like lectin/glucanases superfamily
MLTKLAMNVRGISLLTGIALALIPLPAAAQTVAYYRFDGTNGSPVTTILDSGPSSLNGINVGSTSYSAGVLGAGLNLSGDLNYVSIPASTNFVMKNDFTAELFLKANQPYTVYGSDPATVINKLHTANLGGFLSSFCIEYTANGTLAGFVSYATDVGLYAGPTSASFADGRWHHVALVYRHNTPAGTNTVQLFVDYTMLAAASGTASPVAWGNFPIYIGAGNFPGGQDNGQFRRNFDGSIDEVRISNVALAPSEFVMIPPGQFALVGISKFLGGVDLRWVSQTNHAYQVQFTPQLPASAWTNLGGPLPGNGNLLTLHDAFVSGQSQRYFRVLESP